jgi:hypothetical protein
VKLQYLLIYMIKKLYNLIDRKLFTYIVLGLCS